MLTKVGQGVLYSAASFGLASIFAVHPSPQACMAFVAPLAPSRATAVMTQYLQQQQKSLTFTLMETKAPRHDVSGASSQQQMDLPEHVQQKLMAYQEHQQNAPKLDWATDVRTLVQNSHGFAVMSTFSKTLNGEYPSGSVVGFATDEADGRPLFIFSGMSTHTQDLLKNPKCSLTIASKYFKSAADGRVNLIGSCTLIKDENEKKMAREVYLQKHPGAFWVDFGDFNWFRMDLEQPCRFVGGFARAGTVTPDEYMRAKPDPVAAFSRPIADHMNEDHQSATIAMLQANIPLFSEQNDENPIQEAIITSVDSLGMYVKVTRQHGVGNFLPKQFKVRLPFPRPAVDRKDVRTLIVELTEKAAAASKTERGNVEQKE
jgi:putative heme iron utilization protein